MPTSFEAIIIQNIAALSMALVFIFYLIKKDKETSKTYELFNQTLRNHLTHALKTEVGLTKTLQKLVDCVQDLNTKRK